MRSVRRVVHESAARRVADDEPEYDSGDDAHQFVVEIPDNVLDRTACASAIIGGPKQRQGRERFCAGMVRPALQFAAGPCISRPVEPNACRHSVRGTNTGSSADYHQGPQGLW
jgi:hypothetical protein